MPSNENPWYYETLTRHVEEFEKETEIAVSTNARILIRTSLDALIEDPNSRWMREARHEELIGYYLEHLSELLLAATFHKAVKLRRVNLRYRVGALPGGGLSRDRILSVAREAGIKRLSFFDLIENFSTWIEYLCPFPDDP